MSKKYSNRTKLAFALNAEKEMLSRKEIKSIPYASRNYWRNQNPEKYLDEGQKLDENVVNVNTGDKIKYLRLLVSIRNLTEALIKHIGLKEYHNVLFAAKEGNDRITLNKNCPCTICTCS